MKTIKTILAAVVIATALAGTTLADGILVSNRDGILISDRDGTVKSCKASVKMNAGILVSNIVGILVSNFTGGILVSNAVETKNCGQTNSGILISD